MYVSSAKTKRILKYVLGLSHNVLQSNLIPPLLFILNQRNSEFRYQNALSVAALNSPNELTRDSTLLCQEIFNNTDVHECNIDTS